MTDTAPKGLRRFLARNQISFNWFTPDAPELATSWPGARPPADDGPVVKLADGAVLERPDVRDLANRLGLQTRARAAEYDLAIIGGGPAGLAAAVYGASEGLRTIVVEREAPGQAASDDEEDATAGGASRPVSRSRRTGHSAGLVSTASAPAFHAALRCGSS